MERTYTTGGSDITDQEAKSYMKLKKLLKARGVNAKLVDSCYGVHAIRLLGIKQGVLKAGADDELPDDSEPDEAADAAPPPAPPAPVSSDLPMYYRNAISDDPKLAGVSSMAELHDRMRQLSAEIVDPDGSFWKQLTFSGEHPYPEFEPHRIKGHKGTDGGYGGTIITDYYRYAIKSERHVQNAIEFLSSDVPSPIIENLYHGGFKCPLNLAKMQGLGITTVINTAMGCSGYAKNWDGAMDKNRAAGITILELNWQDCEEQDIEEEKLVAALQLIQDTRARGEGVLVHCMQGKSRSGTVVTAYVAADGNMRIRNALEVVKKGRSQAQPNNNFMNQLNDFERDGLFKDLNKEWNHQ